MTRFKTGVVLLLALLTGPLQANQPGSPDPELEIKRTLQKAYFLVPGQKDLYRYPDSLKNLPGDYYSKKRTLLIYMHGCAGVGPKEKSDLVYFRDQGFLVLAPDSFARSQKPMSCDPVNRKGGLHREVLGMRLEEASAAFQKARSIPQAQAIFLVGWSEGAITAARSDLVGLDGKLVMGWTCHAGWPEYRGLAGPLDTPILTIVSDRDPWFQKPHLLGNCNDYTLDRPKARSIMLPSRKHHVTRHPLVRKTILQFLRKEEL